jgi:predicted nucleic acid-binding protein
VDACDSDVLIYVATGDIRGDEVARLIQRSGSAAPAIASVLVVSEVFGSPAGREDGVEREALVTILANLDLKDVDYETADLAGAMRAKYRLRAPVAIHLATAVLWGAERFHTNNRKDFGQPIDEIEIVFP